MLQLGVPVEGHLRHTCFGVAVRRDIVACIKIDRVDGIGVDELLDLDGGRTLNPSAFEIIVVDDQVMVFLELVSLHQVASLQGIPCFRVLRDHLDPVTSLGIDQVKVQRPAVMVGAVKRDRAGDQRQT